MCAQNKWIQCFMVSHFLALIRWNDGVILDDEYEQIRNIFTTTSPLPQYISFILPADCFFPCLSCFLRLERSIKIFSVIFVVGPDYPKLVEPYTFSTTRSLQSVWSSNKKSIFPASRVYQNSLQPPAGSAGVRRAGMWITRSRAVVHTDTFIELIILPNMYLSQSQMSIILDGTHTQEQLYMMCV